MRKLHLFSKKEIPEPNTEDIKESSLWEEIQEPHNMVKVNYKTKVKVNYSTGSGDYSMLIPDFLKRYRVIEPQ